jgi:hypothetical protein
MWQCFLELIDVTSKIAQTGIAGFAAWLAWQTFVREDAQESDVVEDITPIAAEIPDLIIFQTSKQTTTLKKTENGIECHLDDTRPGKRQGRRWTLTPAMINRILSDGDIYVDPGLKIRTGRVSIGTHTNWLYSKNLFPEASSLHHKVVELLRSANA